MSPVLSFDEWHLARYGETFEEAHEYDGALINASMRALSQKMREYVSEMAEACLTQKEEPTT